MSPIEEKPIQYRCSILRAQYAAIRDEARAAVDAVLESQHSILGPEVAALREETPIASCDAQYAANRTEVSSPSSLAGTSVLPELTEEMQQTVVEAIAKFHRS